MGIVVVGVFTMGTVVTGTVTRGVVVVGVLEMGTVVVGEASQNDGSGDAAVDPHTLERMNSI
jgi:hypothetical protein